MTCYIVLAEWLHIQYEEISKKENWETQKKCQVKFEDLPVENQRVMMELAKRIIREFDLKKTPYIKTEEDNGDIS